VSGVKAELDQLMRAFLGAFTNTGGSRPDVDVVREMFLPQGMIISNVGPEPVIYDLDAFIKSGFRDGEWFEGAGHKTTQFVRTPAGWRMSSMAWDDEH
jgi:hypothetical protein